MSCLHVPIWFSYAHVLLLSRPVIVLVVLAPINTALVVVLIYYVAKSLSALICQNLKALVLYSL